MQTQTKLMLSRVRDVTQKDIEMSPPKSTCVQEYNTSPSHPEREVRRMYHKTDTSAKHTAQGLPPKQQQGIDSHLSVNAHET